MRMLLTNQVFALRYWLRQEHVITFDKKGYFRIIKTKQLGTETLAW
jgi:hypothetical protein